MLYEKPLNKILVAYINYYKEIDSNEDRFVFTGISPKDCERIIDTCEELFGIYYDYMFFTEEKIFKSENIQYPYGCYYFFPYGTRNHNKEITKEEVINLYWY